MKPPFTVNVNSQYGAPIGRPEYLPRHYNGERLHLRRVPLTSGGYDPGGAYWGTGLPLYCAYGHTACNIGEPVELYTRAPSRAAAADKLRAEHARRTQVGRSWPDWRGWMRDKLPAEHAGRTQGPLQFKR